MNGEPDAKSRNSGDILNNKGAMEYHQASCQLSITFRNMSLKRIRRAEKKGNETVTEEKFSIFFQTDLTINSQQTYSVWTLSHPVVVTVHGNQDCNAQATVLWDNAFADCNRILFQVPEKVTWQELSQALNTRFIAHCSLGLSPDNLLYLAYKLFGTADDYLVQVISWAQFNREPLPGRSFTFWEWFHSILKLTKDWAQGPWKDRLILGFISKQRAEDWLLKSQIGAFLLRFSDSELGGISISYVKEDRSQPVGRAVTHVSPFTDKDLRIRGLGDRVKDLVELVNLYPDTPKEKAFQKFWTASVDNNTCYSNGYVKPDLTTTIPRGGKHMIARVGYDDPHTPMGPTSPAAAGNITSSVPQRLKQELYQDNSRHDMMTDQDSDLVSEINMLDYNPDDIAEINVNEILNLNPDGVTAGGAAGPVNFQRN